MLLFNNPNNRSQKVSSSKRRIKTCYRCCNQYIVVLSQKVSSSKRRIKTLLTFCPCTDFLFLRKSVPVKEGLRQPGIFLCCLLLCSQKVSSSKRRIKTFIECYFSKPLALLRKSVPVKEGLRLLELFWFRYLDEHSESQFQ